VNNSGGFVQVRSQPEEGTMFRVYLPLADERGAVLGREAGVADVTPTGP
jgi:hypothetical protein